MPDATIRLQKYLAERGVASRRTAAEMIRAGRVTVNDMIVVEPGHRVTPGQDRIHVDGDLLPDAPEPPRTILMYKPRGYICSRSNKQGKTVFDLLGDIPERLVPVGRLDKDSEGLLLLSNDGDLINRLTHPRFGHTKTYHVTVSGDTGPATIKRLGEPFELDGYRTRPARVRVLKKPSPTTAERPEDTGPAIRTNRTVLEIILTEGRNRQIREMCRQCNLRVHRLVRVTIGHLTADDLKPGEFREVTEQALHSP